jgi:hypothetical protein
MTSCLLRSEWGMGKTYLAQANQMPNRARRSNRLALLRITTILSRLFRWVQLTDPRLGVTYAFAVAKKLEDLAYFE